MKEHRRLSKFLSYILRHHPETIDITLDKGGWCEVKTLLHNAAHYGKPLTMTELEYIVMNNNKNRFELSDDHLFIRARQGHSIPVESGITEKIPPEFLYHGTAARCIESIREKGLLKMGRLYVHLSRDIETALSVGQRHGKPGVLIVRAGAMHEQHYQFYLSSNGVWLIDHVPAHYIIFPDQSQNNGT